MGKKKVKKTYEPINLNTFFRIYDLLKVEISAEFGGDITMFFYEGKLFIKTPNGRYNYIKSFKVAIGTTIHNVDDLKGFIHSRIIECLLENKNKLNI